MKTFVLLSALLTGFSASAATIRVGPGQTYSKPCAAFAAAASGDLVEIDAAGSYVGDVCAITKDLTVRGVNGRPKIDGNGTGALGKGIWVTQGSNITIENVELTNAKVPDANGAGIRAEGANLTVRNSYIHHNQNGILSNNVATMNIVIENSEFAFNGDGSGYTHNLYIGQINSLVFRGNWSHDAYVGHLLKSRAKENRIYSNRLDLKGGGTSSYEIDMPNGGVAYVIGNIIHQSASTQNPTLVSYGAEGLPYPTNALYVVNNTFVNERSSGSTFVNVIGVPSTTLIYNNAFSGVGTVTNLGSAALAGNYQGALGVRDVAALDVCPVAGSPLVDRGVNPGSSSQGVSLTPTSQYSHPRSVVARAIAGAALDAGACEMFGATPTPTPTPTPTATPIPTPTPTPTPTPVPTPTPDTTAPSVTLTSPTSGTTYPRRSTLTMAATASDSGSGVAKVQFYVNGTLVCEDTTAPYSCNWRIRRGTYRAIARAHDRSGNTRSTTEITFYGK